MVDTTLPPQSETQPWVPDATTPTGSTDLPAVGETTPWEPKKQTPSGPGSGSIAQAIGTGVIEAIPYGRQATAAAESGISSLLHAIPQSWQNEDQRKALAGLPQGYGEINKRLYQAGQEAEQAHPFVKAGTSLATGAALLPIGGATEVGAAALSKALPSAARIAPLLSGAGIGGALGAGYGASQGEGLFDPSGAAWGAGAGALGGAAAEPLGWVAGKVGKGVSQFLGRYDPEEEAAAKIGKAYQEDQRTQNAAMTPSQYADAKAAGQPVMAGDLGGGSVRRLARTAANISPEAGNELAQPLGQRFQQQGPRVSSYIDNLFPGKNLNTAIERDRIATEARVANGPAYQKAYSDPNAGAVWSPTLANLMRSPDVQDAVSLAQKKGANDAAINNQAIPQMPFVKDAQGDWSLRTDAQGNAVGIPSLQFWDQVKRGLDSKMGIAKRSGDNDTARQIFGLNDALKNELDQQVPSYAQARASAAKFFGQSNAVDGAETFYKAAGEGPINQMKAQLQSMNPTDREVFARAFAANLQQKASSVADNSDVARQFSNDALRGKMEAALNTPSDPNRAAKMEAFVHRENLMNMLKQKVLGNSTTIEQKGDAGKEGGHAGGILQMIASQFGAPASGAITGGALAFEKTPEHATWGATARNTAIGALAGGMTGLIGRGKISANEATMHAIGKQLASSDPAIYQRALNHVAQTPWLQSALRNLSVTAGGQLGAAYGAGQ